MPLVFLVRMSVSLRKVKLPETVCASTKYATMKALLSFALLLATSFAYGNVRELVPTREGSEVIKMRIQSSQVDCNGASGNTHCFMVQKESSIGTENWEMLREPIEGFSYEAGYIYDVTVKIELVENPSANQSHFRYTLVSVISKQPDPH